MPASYLDENGLEHVVAKAKETFASKKELWNWQKTEKTKAVAFEPVPDSVLEPVVEFKFKETLPAEGEKGPDNPSTIEGVSSATIWRTGKNLRFGGKTEGTYTQNGLTYTYNSDGSITFNGTATEGTFVYLNGGETRIQTKANFTYILSGCPSGGSQDTYSLSCTSPFNGSTVYAIDRGNGFIINKSQDMSWDMYIYINSGITVSNLTFKPQIEIGSIATDYEPPILLSEAIHVFSLGNTYYGGSVNLATGVMTVTHLGFAFDGTEEWRTIGNVGAESDTFRHDLINTSFPELRRHVGWPTCSHFSTETNTGSLRAYLSGVFQETTWFFVVVDTNAVYSTNEAWKAFLATQYANGTPVTIAYQLETPFEVQLDPIQIKSLASLDKYEPRINTIYTDAESVQVGYQKFTAEGNFVHTTGNETIDGIKTIANTRPAARAGETVTSIYFRNPEVTRGVLHPTGRSWTQMLFLDANGEPETNQAGRLGMFELVSPSSATPNSSESMAFVCYKFTDNPNEYNVSSALKVGFDVNKIPYATAPSTSIDRDTGTDIVTRDWLPKDTRIPQKSDLWNWQKTEKNGAVTFKPVPGSDLEPVIDFMFTETPPAEGEKGPENPSVITGVSTARLEVVGKNLFHSSQFPSTFTIGGGVTVTVDSDGTFTLNGTCNVSSISQRQYVIRNEVLRYYYMPVGTRLAFSMQHISGTATNTLSSTTARAQIETKPKNSSSYGYNFVEENSPIATFGMDNRSVNGEIIIVAEGSVFTNYKFKVQLELSNAVTDFEPYSGQNYIISLGDTYYGGSLDIVTGVMTVKSQKVMIDGNCSYTLLTSETNEDRVALVVTIPDILSSDELKLLRSTSSCDILPLVQYQSITNSDECIMFGGEWQLVRYKQIRVYMLRSTLGVSSSATATEVQEAAKTWFSSHSATFIAGYEEPYWTAVQLDPVSISALVQFDKYTPRVNTIYTDAASVQVGYQRFADEATIVYQDQRISEEEIDEAFAE